MQVTFDPLNDDEVELIRLIIRAPVPASVDFKREIPEPPEPDAATMAAVSEELNRLQVTDSAGDEWDPAVHTPSRSKNRDGTWRKKRNNPPSNFGQSLSHLDHVEPPPPAPEPEPEPEPVPEPVDEEAPEPPPETALPATPAPTTMAEMISYVASRMGRSMTAPGYLKPDTLKEVLTANGLPALHALAGKPDAIPVVFAALEAL